MLICMLYTTSMGEIYAKKRVFPSEIPHRLAKQHMAPLLARGAAPGSRTLHGDVLNRATGRAVQVRVRPREHGVQPRRRGRVPGLLLLAVVADRVPLVQDVGARVAVLCDERVRVRDG